MHVSASESECTMAHYTPFRSSLRKILFSSSAVMTMSVTDEGWPTFRSFSDDGVVGLADILKKLFLR